MNKTIEDLVRLAAAGGGLSVDAGEFNADEMVRLVAAGGAKKAPLVVVNADAMKTDDLVRVAAAGQGRVRFDFA